jgi:hypothetical protein
MLRRPEFDGHGASVWQGLDRGFIQRSREGSGGREGRSH